MRPITMMQAQRKVSTKQGELLTWDSSLGGYLSYQDGQNLKLFGKSTQSGTPTPTAPIDIQSVSGDLRVTGATLTGGATIAISGRGIPLGAAIPAAVQASAALLAGVWHDGTQYWCSDTDEPDVLVGGVRKRRKVQRVGRKMLMGTEVCVVSPSTRLLVIGAIPDCIAVPASAFVQSMCSHYAGSKSSDPPIGMFSINNNKVIAIGIADGTTAAQSNAFFAAQYAAGTPVTVDYLLATPVETLSDPVPIPSIRGTTNIYTTSTVQPHLRASVLIQRGATT